MTLRRQRGTAVGAVLVLAVSLGLAGCGNGEGARAGAADAYVVVLDWLLDQPEARFGEDCGDEIVFIESIGPDDIPLDVQVELIEHYADDVELRFIDIREEAVDEEVDRQPVRNDCVLIGLGIVPEGSIIEVRGELYEHRDDVLGFLFDLVTGGQRWSLVEEPTPVVAEGLVDEL